MGSFSWGDRIGPPRGEERGRRTVFFRGRTKRAKSSQIVAMSTVRSILPVVLSLLSPCAVEGAPADDLVRAADAAAAIFVPDRVAATQGVAAPPAANLGKHVVLTDLEEDHPFAPVVDAVVAWKKPDGVIRTPPGEYAEAEGALKLTLPEFVTIVTAPDRLDVNAHFDFLEMAAKLDADPFVDLAFGYITGATPDEALAFVERLKKVQKRKKLPRTMVEFGPASKNADWGGPAAHAVAKGWKRSWGYHGSVGEMVAKKELLEGHGLLRAGGHGMPDGIVDGFSGRDLREREIDLSPSIYFSGPCYCGVTGPWYDLSSGVAKRTVVAPEESFALAAIASGVTALFAGLDPDRGETTSQEMEHLWVEGCALGHAAKSTYDGAALALRTPDISLYRYVDGERRPYRDLAQQMIGGGAGRALFGDPTFTPWKSSAPPPVKVRKKDKRDALELTWAVDKAPTTYWMMNDVYRCGGGWTHRIQFRLEIPPATAAALESFEVARLEAKDGPLDGRFPTAMIERWGDRAYLHVYLVFPRAGQQNTFFVKRDIEARFRFVKG